MSAQLSADVLAIPQLPQPTASICPISYSSEYTAVMDRVRQATASGERSVRVLELTTHAVWLNPAHYTVWQIRRECLQKQLEQTGIDVAAELAFCGAVLDENPKNYQVWHHRQAMLAMHPAPVELLDGELSFLHTAFSHDSKNYHAWTYRQWLLRTFPRELWDAELAWTAALLLDDVWNNSAWNQRYFVLHSHPSGVKAAGDALVAELTWTLQQADRAPANEAPYNYALGTVKQCPAILTPMLLEHCMSKIGDNWKESISDDPAELPREASVSLLRTLVELYEDQVRYLSDPAMTREVVVWSLKMLQAMDKVRGKYWTWILQGLA